MVCPAISAANCLRLKNCQRVDGRPGRRLTRLPLAATARLKISTGPPMATAHGDQSQWAAKLGIDQATAQRIVTSFQQGLITDEVAAPLTCRR